MNGILGSIQELQEELLSASQGKPCLFVEEMKLGRIEE